MQDIQPGDYVVQQVVNNPHAHAPLIIPTLVVRNTPQRRLDDNVRANAARDDLTWLSLVEPHDGVAVIVGGGPSAADHVDDIRAQQQAGATIYALNAASLWLNRRGIVPDYQIIVDAQPTSIEFVDHAAKGHLFGSQVCPSVMSAVRDPIVWHLGSETVESLFPPERVKRGGYTLVGGGAAVGTSAICIAFVMGYRRIDCYGLDSSNRGEETHAYGQPLNKLIPAVDVQWAGKTYRSSVAMKAHAEWFAIIGRKMQAEGCALSVHGDGLLPAMWNTPAADLTERDVYRLLWQSDVYRQYSPGAELVDMFCEAMKPDSMVIDFGCGTGRAALELSRRGVPVFCVDFADNCRDDDAMPLPFLEWDLTQPCHLRAEFGLCTDVMEHIAPDDVDAVITNIMASARQVLFSVSTVDDALGAMVGRALHLTVKPAQWWIDRFTALGHTVAGTIVLPDRVHISVTRGSGQ